MQPFTNFSRPSASSAPLCEICPFIIISEVMKNHSIDANFLLIDINILKIRVYVLVLILTMLFTSCANGNREAQTNKSEADNKETFQEKKNEIRETDRDRIIKNLQGDWRESKYPFRLVQFQNTKVKFTEEGVVEKPKFKQFKILLECPFEGNNIRDVNTKNLFLVVLENKTCEILMVSKDTLTLSGFSTNTNSDYTIVFNRVQ